MMATRIVAPVSTTVAFSGTHTQAALAAATDEADRLMPIIVAINKIDKPDAHPERIKQQLADRGLLAEDWGGDVVMVPVSAKTKTNLDLLLEMICLVSDIRAPKATPGRKAVGSVIEATTSERRR